MNPPYLRIGVNSESAIPNLLPCFSASKENTFYPQKCELPGIEAELMRSLLLGLTQYNHSIHWYKGSRATHRALNNGEVDTTCSIERPNFKHSRNVTFTTSFWTKQYCFIFWRPKNLQFLAHFSPHGPLSAESWIVLMTIVLVCCLAAKVCSSQCESVMYYFERLCLQCSVDEQNSLSYLAAGISTLALMGLFRTIYGTRVASQLVSDRLPPEVTTVDKLMSQLKRSNYRLNSERLGYLLQRRYFTLKMMEPVYDLFKSRNIQKIRDKDGYKFLRNEADARHLFDKRDFMLPVNVQKGRFIRAKNSKVRMICIKDNHETPESIGMKIKRTFNERVNRVAAILIETGIVTRIQRSYLSADISGNELPQTAEVLIVTLKHYRDLVLISGSCYLGGVIIFILERCLVH